MVLSELLFGYLESQLGTMAAKQYTAVVEEDESLSEQNDYAISKIVRCLQKVQDAQVLAPQYHQVLEEQLDMLNTDEPNIGTQV